MITAQHITKSFDSIKAVDDVSLEIAKGSVFGLIGTNGAGKSTMLRMICGILKPDTGFIAIDDQQVYDNPKAKENFFFIADEPYFFPNAAPKDLAKFYSTVYPCFDKEAFYTLLEAFGLEKTRRVSTFSKGMKKQLAILFGICSGTKYLICDETFDGLDPVMRQGIKTLMIREMEDRGLTPVIASHNLRELEDICDHIGLLHRGGVLLSKELNEMKCSILKIQCVFENPEDLQLAIKDLTILKDDQKGSLHTLTIRGNQNEITAYFSALPMVFFELLPLSLEEIFISETEVVGYDIKKLILG